MNLMRNQDKGEIKERNKKENKEKRIITKRLLQNKKK